MADQDHVHVGWSINDDLPALLGHLEHEHPDLKILPEDTVAEPHRPIMVDAVFVAAHLRAHFEGRCGVSIGAIRCALPAGHDGLHSGGKYAYWGVSDG